MSPLTITAVLGVAAAAVSSFLAVRFGLASRALQIRLKPITDVEAEAARVRAHISSEERQAQGRLTAVEAQIRTLRDQYSVGSRRFEDLSNEVGRLEEQLESIESGLYRPHFTYEDSEAYKAAIEEIRDRQKAIVKAGGATHCATTWQVGGSAREGQRMVRQTEKLLLRAFNAEAEAAVSNVSWNNYETMKNRILKAQEVLNKHGTVLQVSLTRDYFDARLRELELVFESAEKKKQEREEQREQRAAQREEEKVQKELERAQEDAAKEETKFEKALAKARSELEDAAADDREAMAARIAELETSLTAAHDKKERAKAQAELTRVGHVYIISNMGAFGNGVVKIGMTRRLEPEERVKELGDASVPFPFDLHALIYSEDAPALETRLHEHFWDRRVNWSNDRKEFFRLDLVDVQNAIREIGLPTEVSMVAEAREFRETVVIRDRSAGVSPAITAQKRFPDDPFTGG